MSATAPVILRPPPRSGPAILKSGPPSVGLRTVVTVVAGLAPESLLGNFDRGIGFIMPTPGPRAFPAGSPPHVVAKDVNVN